MTSRDKYKGLKPVKQGFQSFEYAATDIVLAADFNPGGTKAVLCSADHRIRVYSISHDKVWTSLDQFLGHDAEVLDVQWVSASLGHFFATIGGDNKLKIWQEDPSQRLNGGRRFRCICSQTPLNHVSYVSFGFKSTRSDLWLALMTHDGLLSVFEPADPETLSLWTTLDQLYPFGHHRRGTEARFRLSWHQSEGPSSNALLAGVGPKTLSIAVSALNYVKILRAALLEHVPEATYQFDEMIQMETGNALINEIAWAPGCLRPFDVVATACDDGTVRVFHVDTPCDVNEASEAKVTTPRETCTSQQKQPLVARNVPSGIGAGLAGLSRIKQGTISKTSIKHVSREAAALSHDESSPVWKVRWIYDGSTLVSTLDSGNVHLWRESLDGNFVEFAETESA